MDDKLLAVLLGMVAGTVGYWFTTFWMKPILRYRELRTAIFADLIFYAQVVNADGLSERLQKLFEARLLANRRHSAELAACLLELPIWYKWWLSLMGHVPESAVTQLIGYSNTTEYDVAAKRVEAIKVALGITSKVV
jgi:hypothetical protein